MLVCGRVQLPHASELSGEPLLSVHLGFHSGFYADLFWQAAVFLSQSKHAIIEALPLPEPLRLDFAELLLAALWAIQLARTSLEGFGIVSLPT